MEDEGGLTKQPLECAILSATVRAVFVPLAGPGLCATGLLCVRTAALFLRCKATRVRDTSESNAVSPYGSLKAIPGHGVPRRSPGAQETRKPPRGVYGPPAPPWTAKGHVDSDTRAAAHVRSGGGPCRTYFGDPVRGSFPNKAPHTDARRSDRPRSRARVCHRPTPRPPAPSEHTRVGSNESPP